MKNPELMSVEILKALRTFENNPQQPTENRVEKIARFILESHKRFRKLLSHKSDVDAIFGQTGLQLIGEILEVVAAEGSRHDFDRVVYKNVGAINNIFEALQEPRIRL